MHRGHPRLQRHRAELRPRIGLGQIGEDHGFAAAVAVEARSFVILELEQFQQLRLAARRGDHLQRAAGVAEEYPRPAGVQYVHAPFAEPRQQFHHIEVGDEGVGQLHECRRQKLFSGCHRLTPSVRAGRLDPIRGSGPQSVECHSSNRSRRPTTSSATSPIERSRAKARARSRAKASPIPIQSCTEIIPDAW